VSARTLLAPVACVAALAGLGVGAGLVQPAAGHTVANGHRGRTWAVVPVASGKTVAVYYVRGRRGP